MTEELDDLFSQLQKANDELKVSTTVNEEKTSNDFSSNDDLLELEDENLTKDGRNREEIFQEIENNLKELPKFQTTFDSIGDMRKDKKELIKKLLINPSEQKRQKREKSSEDWFIIPKLSDAKRKSIERDLLLIKHRAALDPKRHYKKQKWVAPDRISVGTIIEDKTEYFSSRLKNKERKNTMLETLMADGDRNKYFKKKYNEIQEKKTSGRKGHYKQVKSRRQGGR
ncbi:hypothetical protein TBLA_0D02560 [Henningerozyma blattae CBS 6284]|uniref:Fcf2 pre-rRNA processing C-terminal domain-containing protein n=1 Tax=Henningerozyma blattae (strain ATCC 34711 / CBS 6284 / DSM 70876 / NBRC 10599 / NRRL Y-10934 / UCD 77-7) TaxID=1071380 RepID=I2H307_HENB6|nr:hypothetical protein TBLA_0D02560 [Tetrapisispora blattae CBS 6284]CCH60759.1 hypothetical protein TBLA_0D02560 [Tetrapisispora blattae CBS 6284]